MLKLGDTKLEIFQYQNPEGKSQNPDRPVCDHGIIHLCLAVSDIREEHARLTDAGVRFNSDPIDMGKETCVYGRDPFGNVLELIEKKS